jgi:hypothetical protein
MGLAHGPFGPVDPITASTAVGVRDPYDCGNYYDRNIEFCMS